MTIDIDLDYVVSEIRQAATESNTEEDLRIRVESTLRRSVFEPNGIPWGSYEVSTKRYGTLVTGSRIDALHSHVVIEYERPGALRNKRNFDHAVDQVKNGILGHSRDEGSELARYFGVVTDGLKIGFVRFRRRLNGFEVTREPVEVNRNMTARLIEAVIGLKRKALDAEELLADFGPNAALARKVIRVFYDKLDGRTSERTLILFEDWKRVFSQVCAYDVRNLKGLEEYYGFTLNRTDVEKLFFSIHTYIALLMKFLAAEIGFLYWPIMGSFLRILEEASYRGVNNLRDRLRDLEEGSIFTKLGILNFLEGDYFGWYLDEWDSDTSAAVASVVLKLSDYDPSTAELEPEKVKDLFKRLYQNLVPGKIRHDLGEFYTPDWLSEMVLDEIGFRPVDMIGLSGDKTDASQILDIRVLDPSCGSGTFLIAIIKRLREHIEEHWIDKNKALAKITKNVVGFDLNPLAVMASRANYLIAIGDLLREKGDAPIEIPIYLADSILVERRTTLMGTSAYVLRTVAGEFRIPVSVIERGLHSQVLNILEQCLKLNYSIEDFFSYLQKYVLLDESEFELFRVMYSDLLKLEAEGKNRIWLRILRNSFAPLLNERFNYVVGNPPWVNWESLPDDYRKSTRPLWIKYGLIRSTQTTELGRTRRDLATLFTSRCFEQFLAKDGVLAFLIPLNILRTQGGDGFRLFLSKKTELVAVHDLSETYPFEGATNRAGLIIVRNGNTSFPVPCKVWSKSNGRSIPQEMDISDVRASTKRADLVLVPILAGNAGSPWAMSTIGALNALQKLVASSAYTAHEGLNPALTGVFWVDVKGRLDNQLIIENWGGKKKVVDRIHEVIDPNLTYPLLRGKDVKKWYGSPHLYIVFPHQEKNGEPIPERTMKADYPRTLRFLMNFKKELENRSIHKLWGKGKPFYSIYGVGDYTLRPYKVVWKDISGRVSSRAEFGGAVVIKDFKDPYLGLKPILPDGTLMFIPCECEEEAFYLAAILNCFTTRLIVASYAVLHARGHIMKYLGIAKFDPNDLIHVEIANLSKKAHQSAINLYDKGKNEEKENIIEIEGKIEDCVNRMYNLSSADVKAAKESLSLLMDRDVET